MCYVVNVVIIVVIIVVVDGGGIALALGGKHDAISWPDFSSPRTTTFRNDTELVQFGTELLNRDRHSRG